MGLKLNMASLPKISCLTATYNRLFHLKQAIQCYCDQTYPNKELIIVSEAQASYTDAIVRYVSTMGRRDIKLIFPKNDQLNLGKIRNILLESASGDIVCQWDDDDLYHPTRLKVQADYMMKESAAACFMTDQFHFFWKERKMYWVDWALANRYRPLNQLIPGTMMMFKQPNYKYPEEGEFARQGEDSVFLEQIYQQLPVATLRGRGYLYVYSYHGKNTFSEYHHQQIPAYHSFSLSQLRQNEHEIRRSLPYYKLPRPYHFLSKDSKKLFSWN